MRTPNLVDANAFLAVIEHGNFARAAAHLGVSPPTLSRMISKFEEELSVRVLNRTRRSVAPTAMGQHLLEQLRPVLNDYAAALESINLYRDKPAGTLRILVRPWAAQYVLAPILPAFMALYPAIKLEVSANTAGEDIVAGHFDAGIQMGNQIARDMIAARIGKEIPIAIVGSPDYFTRNPLPKTPFDLKAHNCICVRQPNGALSKWAFNYEGKSIEIDAEGSLIVDEMALATRAAMDGIGLSTIAVASMRPFVDEGKLIPVLQEWCAPVDAFYLYYSSRSHIPGPMQALINFLKKNVSTRQ